MPAVWSRYHTVFSPLLTGGVAMAGGYSTQCNSSFVMNTAKVVTDSATLSIIC